MTAPQLPTSPDELSDDVLEHIAGGISVLREHLPSHVQELFGNAWPSGTFDRSLGRPGPGVPRRNW